MTDIIDEFVLTTQLHNAKVIEERIKMRLQPKPKWMPTFVWHKIIKRLLVIEHQTVS
jgi:hypothetical protein